MTIPYSKFACIEHRVEMLSPPGLQSRCLDANTANDLCGRNHVYDWNYRNLHGHMALNTWVSWVKLKPTSSSMLHQESTGIRQGVPSDRCTVTSFEAHHLGRGRPEEDPQPATADLLSL